MKIEKEPACLREFAIETDWTERFSDFFDRKFKLETQETILRVNPETGNHITAVREKLDD